MIVEPQKNEQRDQYPPGPSASRTCLPWLQASSPTISPTAAYGPCLRTSSAPGCDSGLLHDRYYPLLTARCSANIARCSR